MIDLFGLFALFVHNDFLISQDLSGVEGLRTSMFCTFVLSLVTKRWYLNLGKPAGCSCDVDIHGWSGIR